MLRIFLFILISYKLAFASFEGVSSALENYIQSSYELSSLDAKKDFILYKTLNDEKIASQKDLLAALKEPLLKKDIDAYLQRVKNQNAKRLYLDFYDYLYSFHLYLNKNPSIKQKQLNQRAKLLNEELKNFVLSSEDESYKGFLLKTRALFLKDILHRMQKDLLRADAYYLNSLNFQGVINWINEKIGMSYLNTGKLIICVLVLFIFYILRLLFVRISTLLVYKYLYYFKKSDDKDFKELFLHKLQKPIEFFITLYSVGLCVAILYYPDSINEGIFRLFNLFYLWTIVWFIINLLNSYGLMLISKIAIKSGQKEIINLIIKMLFSLIIIIALLTSLRLFGFDISTIMASLGIGGLAVALASKDIISNFFASIMLLFDESFEQGDWVRIGNIEGNIVETGLRKTSIRGFDNSLSFIPNSTIMGSNIINFSRRKLGRRVSFLLGLTYSSKPDQIIELSKAIRLYLQNSPHVAQSNDKENKKASRRFRQNLINIDDLEGYSSKIYVGLNSFGDFSINIEVSFYTKKVDGVGHRMDKEQVLLAMLKLVSEHGLSLAFPTQSIYIEKNG